MAKRTIQECDLTKQEYDPDETVSITIKKKGKGRGRTYDLSPEAASKLEQQLVAGSEAVLDPDWTFGSSPKRIRSQPSPVDEWNISGDDHQEEPEDDSNFVAAKKAELKDQGVINKDDEPREVENSVFKDSGNCAHMNRGPVQMTMRNNERYAYTICKDCGRQLPVKKRNDRDAYMSARLPSDVNMRDMDGE